MRIAIIVEGDTEDALRPYLRKYLKDHFKGRMPKLDMVPCDGRVPTGKRLQRMVENLLTARKNPADAVIALTDVYTGTDPPDFIDAVDAKEKMRKWVGPEPRFHPHVALHDFEAWLLPYWDTIQRLSGGHNKNAPSREPESVNHNKPPSYWIKEIFRIGSCSRHYNKPRDGGRILRDNGLSGAISQCPELKALVNRIIVLSGGTPIP